jgi:S1-C subfamily serine protease
LGEEVIAIGYPLRGILASGPSVSVGNISALAGMFDDSRMLQISSPVQPGNSGGPLLNHAGNVLGVVTSKLDALKVAKETGDVPQNVNFALKSLIVMNFLDSAGIPFVTTTSARRETPSIAEDAKKAILLIECGGNGKP